MYDNFNDIDYTKIERIETKPKIYSISLTHFYQDLGEKYAGKPIKTSIKLEKVNNIWKEIITHFYLDFQNLETIKENITEIENPQIENCIKKLENHNLKNYKNNYFDEEFKENPEYWQIEYNERFKIVGTYNEEIDILKELISFLNFSEIKNSIITKLKTNLQEINNLGDILWPK